MKCLKSNNDCLSLQINFKNYFSVCINFVVLYDIQRDRTYKYANHENISLR